MRGSNLVWIAACWLVLSCAGASARANAKSDAAVAVELVRTNGNNAYAKAIAAGEDAVEGLLGIVKDKRASYEARATAINALGEIGSKKAVRPLLVALKDPDQRIRRCAVMALGKIGDPAARPAMTKLAASDPFAWNDPQTGQLRYLVREDARTALEILSQRMAAGSQPANATASTPMLAMPAPQAKYDRLPWPHQAPGLSSVEVEKLNREVWVINDYPLYQADEDGKFAYVHGGLDIVLDNGTRIYAMKDGWVKTTAASTVTIADASDNRPSCGWEYTHLGNLQVRAGQAVKRGTWIGNVEFKGLPHVHLTKVYSQGQAWGQWRYVCMPNGHFDYTDTQPPVIAAPFKLVRNNSTTQIPPDASGNVVLAGKVDIVVGIRDPGEFAHSRESGFGDRLGVSRIEWEVRPMGPAGGPVRKFVSFDFEHMAIKCAVYERAFNTAMAKTLYAHWANFEAASRSGDKTSMYYVITNCPQTGDVREPRPDWAENCWDTTQNDGTGTPMFPDGRYQVVVRAWDFRANHSQAVMEVLIRNRS